MPSANPVKSVLPVGFWLRSCMMLPLETAPWKFTCLRNGVIAVRLYIELQHKKFCNRRILFCFWMNYNFMKKDFVLLLSKRDL